MTLLRSGRLVSVLYQSLTLYSSSQNYMKRIEVYILTNWVMLFGTFGDYGGNSWQPCTLGDGCRILRKSWGIDLSITSSHAYEPY